MPYIPFLKFSCQGPQRISYRATEDEVPFEANMLITDGMYMSICDW